MLNQLLASGDGRVTVGSEKRGSCTACAVGSEEETLAGQRLFSRRPPWRTALLTWDLLVLLVADCHFQIQASGAF
jgi:hypothetical protein